MPLLDDRLRFLETVEDLPVEQFVAKTLLRNPGFPARNLGRFRLAHRNFNLTKQRHNLLRAKPFLGNTKLLSKSVTNKPLGPKRACQSHISATAP